MQAACLPTYGTLSQADNDSTDSAGPHKERMLQRLAPSLGLSRHSDILRKQWPDKVVDTVQWTEYHGAECLLLSSLVDRVPRCRVLTTYYCHHWWTEYRGARASSCPALHWPATPTHPVLSCLLATGRQLRTEKWEIETAQQLQKYRYLGR